MLHMRIGIWTFGGLHPTRARTSAGGAMIRPLEPKSDSWHGPPGVFAIALPHAPSRTDQCQRSLVGSCNTGCRDKLDAEFQYFQRSAAHAPSVQAPPPREGPPAGVERRQHPHHVAPSQALLPRSSRSHSSRSRRDTLPPARSASASRRRPYSLTLGPSTWNTALPVTSQCNRRPSHARSTRDSQDACRQLAPVLVTTQRLLRRSRLVVAASLNVRSSTVTHDKQVFVVGTA